MGILPGKTAPEQSLKNLASKQKQAIGVIYPADHANRKNRKNKRFKYLNT